MNTLKQSHAGEAAPHAFLPCCTWSILILSLFLPCMAAAPATAPTSLPASPENLLFCVDFRIAHYLETAAALQKLDPDHRAARLRELAADAQHRSEIFPLCRMLFQAKGRGEFRHPGIGSAGFVGHTPYTDWPLEPITLRDDVPILIVTFWVMGGRPEPPIEYLDYCLEHCEWRDIKYSTMEAARIKQIVEEFIAANPKFTKDDATFLRRQCE